MSLNIQNNVTMPQNEMSFKAQLHLPRKMLKQSVNDVPKVSFLQKVQLYILGERALYRPITLKTYIKAIKAALGINPDGLYIHKNRNFKFDNKARLSDMPADNAHFITKDLETDVAANIGRRLKEQLLREQGWRFDAAKDIEGYKI